MGSFDSRNQQGPSADIIFCNMHYSETPPLIKNLEKVNSTCKREGDVVYAHTEAYHNANEQNLLSILIVICATRREHI